MYIYTCLFTLTYPVLIYTRGESTMGAKRLVAAKRPGGKCLGGETLGEEMVWGQNFLDSNLLHLMRKSNKMLDKPHI